MTRHAIGSGRSLFALPNDQFINASKPLQALFSNNSIEDEMTSVPKVYAAGGATIRKLPVETPTDNGVKISIGFPVCTLTEWCDEQADAVAEIMNRGEAYEANQARIAELENALRPFAGVGDIFEMRAGNRPNDNDDPVNEWEGHRVGARRLTVGDFRTARAALSGAKP